MATVASIGVDATGLSELKRAARAGQPQAGAAAAQAFEAMFVRMMLTAMRETEFDDSLSGGAGAAPYRDWFDARIAEDIAARGELGLAAVFEREFGASTAQRADQPHVFRPRQVDSAATGSPAASAPAAPRSKPRVSRVLPAGDGPRAAIAATPAEFVVRLQPHAEAAARELGTSPTVLLAQAALETGWGRRLPQHPDGRPTYNMFGIKANLGWEGARVRVPTLEFEDGVAVRRHDEFRSYDSVAASFADYVDFLKTRPAYQDALRVAEDPARYLTALQQAGYATDPHYARKILTIMEGLPQSALVLARQDR